MLAVLGWCLSSCTNKAADLEKQYEIVKRSYGTKAELCARAKAVAEAYLEQHDRDAYLRWDATASNHCIGAQLDALR